MSNLKAPNRDILETVILPEFASWPDVRRLLFVGCAEYTRDYENYFAGHDYYTIDVDPAAAAYGASTPCHHFVDSVAHVGRYLQPPFFDVILLNGVFFSAWTIRSVLKRRLRPAMIFWLRGVRMQRFATDEAIRAVEPGCLGPFRSSGISCFARSAWRPTTGLRRLPRQRRLPACVQFFLKSCDQSGV
jgi:hypothetical protein